VDVRRGIGQGAVRVGAVVVCVRALVAAGAEIVAVVAARVELHTLNVVVVGIPVVHLAQRAGNVAVLEVRHTRPRGRLGGRR